MAGRHWVALCALGVVTGTACGDLFHDTSWAEDTQVGGAGATTTALTSTGAGGAGGGTPTCPEGASPLDAPCAIDEERGVFVRTEGRAGAAGTRADPFASIEEAVAAAGGRTVFLCAQTFTGPVEVPAGSWLVGGLDCEEAAWPLGASGELTRLVAPADVIPLVAASGAEPTRVERLEVIAADAARAGGSSIALLAHGVEIAVRDCNLLAGRGGDGTAGDAGADAGPAVHGQQGAAACSGTGQGGPGGGRTCEGVQTSGGRGGDGGDSTPQPGGDGLDGAPLRGAGAGGEGQPFGTGWTCTDEGNGRDGADGDPTGPGSAAGPGALTATGFFASGGGSGASGTPGRGGGGGGGGRGVASATCPYAAGGGGGGAGGCGGKGGRGGRGGGASFAIVAVDAMVRVDGGRLAASPGGAGGDGGPGGIGGAGGSGRAGGAGNPAESVAQGCSGGDGGRGGDGGAGSGGRGGPAAGVAFTGAAPELGSSVTIVLPEAPGPGGDTPGAAAAPAGELAETLAFP